MTVDDRDAATPERPRLRRDRRSIRDHGPLEPFPSPSSSAPGTTPLPEGFWHESPTRSTSRGGDPYGSLFDEQMTATPPLPFTAVPDAGDDYVDPIAYDDPAENDFFDDDPRMSEADDPGALTSAFGVLRDPGAFDLADATATPRKQDPPTRPTDALAWVNDDAIVAVPGAAALGALPPGARASGDLLATYQPRPRWIRGSVITPPAIFLTGLIGYSLCTALWPLDAIAPRVVTLEVTPAAVSAAGLTWPSDGSAAISVEGINAATSSEEHTAIASITKTITVLAALDAMPLAPGEQGPAFSFTEEDSYEYWQYLWSDQSALDVPVDGTLTEYQLIEGIMLGSANNYADRLAAEIWGDNDSFQTAIAQWMADNGLSDIELVDPSGIGWENTASPRALMKVAQMAVEHPVLGPIVAQHETNIPGAGEVSNSNRLLDEPGFIGVKTGSQDDHYNVLSAKEFTVGDRTVTLTAAVLGQPDRTVLYDVSRDLYAQVEAQLLAQADVPTVASGTLLGTITTDWGASADVVTSADAHVTLWNAVAAETTVSITLGDQREKGATAGELTVAGPLGEATVDAVLSEAVPNPSFWWRFTHPLELFGLAR